MVCGWQTGCGLCWFAPLWCGLNESFSHLHVLPSPPMSIRNCVFVYTDLCIIFRMRIIIYSCMYHISSRIHGGVILCPSRPRACLRCIGIHALTIMDECLLPCSARYCTRDARRKLYYWRKACSQYVLTLVSPPETAFPVTVLLAHSRINPF